MLAEDYERDGARINRLQAIKPIIDAFITRRPSDRIGIVAFGGRAYTLAPLTSDHDWLHQQVRRLKVGLIEDGTAIGDGLVARRGAPRPAGSRAGRQAPRRLRHPAHRRRQQRRLAAAARRPPRSPRPRAFRSTPSAPARTASCRCRCSTTSGHKLGYRDAVSDLDEPTLRDDRRHHRRRATSAPRIPTPSRPRSRAIDRERKIEFDATPPATPRSSTPGPRGRASRCSDRLCCFGVRASAACLPRVSAASPRTTAR